MQAMILTGPPQAWQVSMSILNTRFKRCAQVGEARRSAGGCESSAPLDLLPLPRLAGAAWGMTRVLAILCFYTVYRSTAGS